MDAASYLTSLRADVASVAATPPERLDAPVTTCPGWSIADLVTHLGRIHRWARANLAIPQDGEMAARTPPPGFVGRDLLDWFTDGADELMATFADSDLDVIHPTFAGPRPGAWWLRRQALETAVHRWDVQHALGDAAPIPRDVAADGIDEWLVLQSARQWTPPHDLVGSIHLHGTDGPGEWLLRFDGTMEVEVGHHKGDTAVRGALSDLYLLLWGRITTEPLDVIGDDTLLARFLDSL